MIRGPAVYVLLCILVPMEGAAAQAASSKSLPSNEQELSIGYEILAEAQLERLRNERPALVDEAQRRRLSLADQIDELQHRAQRGGGRGIEASPDDDLNALQKAVEDWAEDKTVTVPAEIRFTAGRLTSARRALAPVTILIEKRERRQRLIAEVVLLIKNVVVERMKRQKEENEPEIENGKTSRLQSGGIGQFPGLTE
jgi:hypothetical protein